MNRPIQDYLTECQYMERHLCNRDEFQTVFVQADPAQRAKKVQALQAMCHDDNVFLAFVIGLIQTSHACARDAISNEEFCRFMLDCSTFVGEEDWQRLGQKLANIQIMCSFVRATHVRIWLSYPNGSQNFPFFRRAAAAGNRNNQDDDNDDDNNDDDNNDDTMEVSLGDDDANYQKEFDDNQHSSNDTLSNSKKDDDDDDDDDKPVASCGGVSYADENSGLKLSAPSRDDAVAVLKSATTLERAKAFAERQRRTTVITEQQERRMTIDAEAMKTIREEEARRTTVSEQNEGYRLQIQLAQMQLRNTPPPKPMQSFVSPATTTRKRKASPNVTFCTPKTARTGRPPDFDATLCEFSVFTGNTPSGIEIASALNVKCGHGFVRKEKKNRIIQWNGMTCQSQTWYCPCRESAQSGISECVRVRLVLTHQGQALDPSSSSTTDTWTIQRSKKFNVHRSST